MGAFSVFIIVAVVVFVVYVTVVAVKKFILPSSIDEELEEYEALLRERERRGMGMTTTSKQEVSVSVPIVNSKEAAAVSASIPSTNDISQSLSDEELLKDADESDTETK